MKGTDAHIWNTTIAPRLAYATPPDSAPTRVPNARKPQHTDCMLPVTFSFFAMVTMMLSVQTSA